MRSRRTHSTLSIFLPLRSLDDHSHYVRHSPLRFQEVRNLFRMFLARGHANLRFMFFVGYWCRRGAAESSSINIRLNRNLSKKKKKKIAMESIVMKEETRSFSLFSFSFKVFFNFRQKICYDWLRNDVLQRLISFIFFIGYKNIYLYRIFFNC